MNRFFSTSVFSSGFSRGVINKIKQKLFVVAKTSLIIDTDSKATWLEQNPQHRVKREHPVWLTMRKPFSSNPKRFEGREGIYRNASSSLLPSLCSGMRQLADSLPHPPPPLLSRLFYWPSLFICTYFALFFSFFLHVELRPENLRFFTHGTSRKYVHQNAY